MSNYHGDVRVVAGTRKNNAPLIPDSNGAIDALTIGTLTLSSPIVGSSATSITAFATGGQASATALTAGFNNVTTCATAGDSVKLATVAAGTTQTVKNNGAASLAVFPASGNSINGMAVNLSIDIPVGGEVTFRGVSATNWQTNATVVLPAPSTQKGTLAMKAADNAANYAITLTNASFGQATTLTIPDTGANANFVMSEGAATINGVKTFGSIKQNKATNAITAFAGGGQGSATALVSEINSITVCATAGDSVKLPTSVAGMRIQVSNLGAAYANIFPASGDLIDSLSANTAVSLPVGESIVFTCAVAGSWKATSIPMPGGKFTTGTTTTTFAAGQLTGAAFVVYENTQGTPGSIATRTATQMFADDPYARVGGKYHLRINNNQGTGTLTVTAGSGVTLTGTMTIAINTYRDFVVTYTSATALVIQQVGIGTGA